MKLNKKEKGQTLIEVLVALATGVAVISAMAVTVITSLNNVEFTKNQNQATQYSREGVEIVRRLARSNWATFAGYRSTNYCLAKGASTLTIMGGNNCGQNADIFVRQIIIEQNSPGCQSNAKISSVVSWSDSKCEATRPFCHEVRLDSCIADINSISPL